MPERMEILEKTFGYRSFLPGQQRAVDCLLSGRDCLAVMPTGGGKSICYQLPALCLPGITIVVSPLISLMKDQVESLIQSGVPAAYLNRSLTEKQYNLALQRAEAGWYKIIYVAPERLHTPSFQRFARYADIRLVAVDEAHCVSQWGPDFRPSHLRIPDFLEGLPHRPVVGAFTATATAQVREDILKKLGLEQPESFVTGFDRENLRFDVVSPEDKKAELLRQVEQYPGQCGIIYCATRKAVEQVHEFLLDRGISATRYHAGLDQEERQKNQEDFLYDRVQVVVATNAFGMGIDKSNVRFVIHYNMPKDLEGYYQEAGRAGRDGAPANCTLLFARNDVNTAKFLIEHGEIPETLTLEEQTQLRERQYQRLGAMISYCTTQDCLRGYILRYFGENPPESCGNCGNCQGEFHLEDVTRAAGQVLDCVRQMPVAFGATTVTAVLRGGTSEVIRKWHLDELPVYGIQRGKPAAGIRRLVDFMVDRGYLTASEELQSVLSPGPRAGEMAMGAQILMRHRGTAPRIRREQPRNLDTALFERLRKLRRSIASRNGVPAYLVFSDKTLESMARIRPTTRAALMEVPGVGISKADRYGRAFLDEIKAHLEDN